VVGGLLAVEGGQEGVDVGFEGDVGGGSEDSETDALCHVVVMEEQGNKLRGFRMEEKRRYTP